MKLQAEYLEDLRRLSAFAREKLPTYGSWSCWDLGLVLVKAALESRELTIKQVSLSLSCAESNIRRYLRHLERDGWIRIRTNPRDHRSSIVTATDAMIQIYQSYLTMQAQAAERLLQARRRPDDRAEGEARAFTKPAATDETSRPLETCVW